MFILYSAVNNGKSQVSRYIRHAIVIYDKLETELQQGYRLVERLGGGGFARFAS